MKIRVLQTAFAALLLLTIPAAQAWDPAGYWGFGVGRSKANFYTDNFTSGGAASESVQDTDYSGKVFLGFPMSRDVMAEFSYTNLGRFHYIYQGANKVNLSYKVNGFGASILPIAHLGESFSIHGRFGVFFSNTTATPDGALAGVSLRSGNNIGLSFLVGAGAQYDFNRTYAVRADLESYGKIGDPNTTGQARILMSSVNLVLTF